MKLSEKIHKLFTPDVYRSAAATLRRMTYPLPVKPFIDAINRKEFDEIRARHVYPGYRLSPRKYLDLEEWMRTNVKRIRDHRIRKAPPRLRILDIGSGSGYFLHVAKCLGHDVLGLDRDDEPVFRETCALLGVPRVIHDILPFQPLPDLGEKFDLITAHMTCFNRHADESFWERGEWEYFLNDLRTHLVPGGRIQFELNPLFDYRHMEPDLHRYFLSLGARIDRRKVYLPPAPAS